ncbi:MAG TPA: hypothetical protein VFA55_07285 [Candidatus Kapabacteria bacterium]|nr:hypothetical protein [Candidatus Kapabacteria bacterium]
MKNPILEEFITKVEKREADKQAELSVFQDWKRIASVPDVDNLAAYAIELIIAESADTGLLLEYEQYKKFKSSTNRYAVHPENPNIPVKRHYHVYPKNGKEEIYAVNVDGTAHHGENKGFQVPPKEADELRRLGVKIPSNNIIEQKRFSADSDKKYMSFLLTFDEDKIQTES